MCGLEFHAFCSVKKLDAWLKKNIPNLKDRKQIKEIITRKILKPQT